ncbi:PPOX class probable F420-dependent enzyme [Streptacidiphilus sp. MAP12-20]|uniref:PPOX class F420-dependent oxidoreductase n=1 Tax=Streptacidiphilus sp. MAP12-20 TaxID=3156299 RepID=UPI003510F3A7
MNRRSVAPQVSSRKVPEGKYVLLTTYAPDGTPWRRIFRAVPDGDALGIVLRTGSAEADRVRGCRRVVVGVCDARGNLAGREWSAEAMLCSPEQTVEYRIALINKYGMTAMLSLALARLRQGIDGTTGVRLTPAGRSWSMLGPDWWPGAAYSLN